MTESTTLTSTELDDLLSSLARHRYFLRFTVQNLTDEQARSRPVASSELTLGGLVKHVTAGETTWMDFAVNGAPEQQGEIDFSDPTNPVVLAWQREWAMQDGETLEGLLAAYESRAAKTEATLRTLDLNQPHELPKAPWFEPGATWTVRRVILHLIAETSQHAGHADILREAIDGQKTMG